MPAQNPVQRLAALSLKITDSLAWLAPLLTRLLIGVGLFYTGRGKLENLGRVTGFFASLGIPFPHANAILVATLEFVGGICIVAGFATRIFSFLLCCSLLVALLTADRDTFVSKFAADLTDVTSLVYLMFLLWLVLYGGGAVSIDHFLAERLHLGKARDNMKQTQTGSMQEQPKGL